MRLYLKIRMGVAGDEWERKQIERLRAKIDQAGRLSAKVTLDTSLANDLCGIMNQLGDLLRRARARKAKRRRPPKEE